MKQTFHIRVLEATSVSPARRIAPPADTLSARSGWLAWFFYRKTFFMQQAPNAP